jgi:hypothetical protein
MWCLGIGMLVLGKRCRFLLVEKWGLLECDLGEVWVRDRR